MCYYVIQTCQGEIDESTPPDRTMAPRHHEPAQNRADSGDLHGVADARRRLAQSDPRYVRRYPRVS